MSGIAKACGRTVGPTRRPVAPEPKKIQLEEISLAVLRKSGLVKVHNKPTSDFERGHQAGWNRAIDQLEIELDQRGLLGGAILRQM